jgi:hypothetical protein
MAEKSDPIKDPEFQKIVQAFLHAKSQSRKSKKEPAKKARKAAAKR